MNTREPDPGQREVRLKRVKRPLKREERLQKSGGAAHARRSQRGVAAIEFALVFPLFFVIFYSIVTYGLIFAANQTLALAAQEGGRAALRYEGETTLSGAYTLRKNAACTTAQGLVAWIPKAQATCTTQACTGGMQCVTVQMTYDYGTYPLVPNLPLMGFATPSTLGAQVVVQLDPASIQANL
jgi:Flp pilus assembly protein TadG